MDKYELIKIIVEHQNDNEYSLAEKLLDALNVTTVDTLDKTPTDLFCEDALILELERLGYEITDTKDTNKDGSLDDTFDGNPVSEINNLSIYKK
ncbi:hypothetical protein [Fangia hongkongensis]|uniref:hypothetical protein n=1 Tax=Fangia hongkongensis TaxID=270495 RepID=UPI00037234F8|nr:hypothetical protein [Fangia hongkongensis]MBK2125280.1 hypothetical protein [Fangia hongkongensis]